MKIPSQALPGSRRQVDADADAPALSPESGIPSEQALSRSRSPDAAAAEDWRCNLPHPLRSATPKTDRKSRPLLALAPLLRSGGKRETKPGDAASASTFFVRQDPAQFPADPEQWLPGSGEPWPVFSSKMSHPQYVASKPPHSWPPLSDQHRHQEDIDAKLHARKAELVRAPSSYSQHVDASGQWAVQEHKHYTPLREAVPFDSQSTQALPTHTIDLYQYTYGVSRQAGETSIPDDVSSLEIKPWGQKSAENLGKNSSVSKMASVDCHDLGGDFWVFRAKQKPLEGTSRRVLVITHGNENSGAPRLEIPEGKDLAFFAPSGGLLIALHPLSAQEFSPASVHRVRDGEHEIDVHLPLAKGAGGTDDIFALHAGTLQAGGVAQVQVSKLSYPPDHEASATLDATHNLKEKAAWLAFESGNDVVIGRKMPKSMPQRDLSGLMRSLEEKGLMADYEGFDFHLCRVDLGKPFLIHSMRANPASGSKPVASVKKKVVEESAPKELASLLFRSQPCARA